MKSIAAVVLLVAASAIAPAQEPAQTGSIGGTVTIDGKPAPGVAVMVSVAKSWNDVKIVSRTAADKEGKFAFADLGPGEYTILPNAPAYVVNGEARSWKPGVTVTLGDGEHIEGLALALERGGVITGRVYDANGRPVISEDVHIAAVDENGKRLQSDNWFGGTNRTDDRGIYRVFGLKPGRYIVSAGKPADGISMGYRSASKSYPATYYPGVLDEGRATPVEVSTGGEVGGIDIGFGRVAQNYAAAGRVVDENGEPAQLVNVAYGSVRDGRLTGSIGFSGASNERGEFRFTGLAPGSYAAIVMPGGTSGRTAAPVYFDVVDHDVAGIEITMKKGVTVAGSVVLEGPSGQNPAELLQSMVVYVSAKGGRGGVEAQMATKSARIDAAGTFTIKGVSPGTYQIGVISMGKGKGLSVTRIEVGGVPLSGELEVTADADVGGVVMVLASGTGTIRGHVTVTGGTLSSQRMGVGFRRADSQAREQPATIDDRGQFLIEGLAPGEYVLFVRALTGDGPANWLMHNGKEQRITVANGATADASLTLDLENDPTEKP